MSDLNWAERVVNALKQLEQFQPSSPLAAGVTIHALNGARVEATPGEDGDEGWLMVTYPGGSPFRVNGDRFLDLQIVESVRFERDGLEGDKGPYCARVADLTEHLRRKHDLE